MDECRWNLRDRREEVDSKGEAVLMEGREIFESAHNLRSGWVRKDTEASIEQFQSHIY